MNTFKKIGLFDSGLGGLSVLQVLLKTFPEKEFIYFADTLHLPYGEKSQTELNAYCIQIQDFMLSLSVDALVNACNTTSSLYLDQKSYKNIPLFNIIDPAVKKTIELSQSKKNVGVLATSFTVESQVYPQYLLSLNPHLKVYQQSAPLLAEFVEKDWIMDDRCQLALKNYLHPLLKQKIDILVLACAHYFFLIDEIKKLTPSHIDIVDPCSGLVSYLCPYLSNRKSLSVQKKEIPASVQIYVSQNNPQFLNLSKKILNPSQVNLQKIHLNETLSPP